VAERPRTNDGGALVEPHLDIGKIPKAAWGGVLLNEDAPMKAPKTLWKTFFKLAEETPVTLGTLVGIMDQQVDAELEELRVYDDAASKDDEDDDDNNEDVEGGLEDPGSFSRAGLESLVNDVKAILSRKRPGS
jgi:hypothetical protein